jgi:hypothetical protein
MSLKGIEAVFGMDCGDCVYVKGGCKDCNAEKGTPF